MIMCIIGFLIYWILSIKSRTLQFGILRAMGMSFREIIAMILYEQILVSGVAIIIAVVIGSVASDLFVPLSNRFTQPLRAFLLSRLSPSERIPQNVRYYRRYACYRLWPFSAELSEKLISTRLLNSARINCSVKKGQQKMLSFCLR